MNKLYRIPIIVLLLLSSCKSNKKAIELNLLQSESFVVLKFNKEYKKIIKIQLPVNVTITNNSINKRVFNSIKYQYNDYRDGIGTLLCIKSNNNNLIRLKNNRNIELKPYSKNEYIIYSTHRLDSVSSIQQQFQPYIEKMLQLDQDTLHIGTVTEFKKKHKELFNRLTKNDSISIRFLDKSTKSGLGERITVPVEW